MVAATALKQNDPPAEKPEKAELAPAKSLLAAIAAVMAEVGTVAKHGENKFHGYNYATASDILFAVQPLMAKHGLVIFQAEKSHEVCGEGKAMAFSYEFTLAHASGETWPEKPVHTGVATAYNSKGGFDDKVANKCHTAARKYFLLALFQIPTGDYPDPDADAPQQGKAEPPKQQQTNGQQRANGQQTAAPKQQGNGQGSNGKATSNGQQQSNGKANGQQKQAGTVDIVNPGTGEIIKFEKRSLWLNFLEAKLNHSDDPLSWFDMNRKTFDAVAVALEPVAAGKEHCDRIKQLVADLKKAATDPVNTSGALDNDEPDYSSAP